MLLETKNQPNVILYVTTIDDNLYHFNKLFKLRDEIEQLPQDCLNIKVDFHYCEFLGHYGVAFLGGIFRFIEARGGFLAFDWNTLPEKISMNLAQNGFLCDFGCDSKPWDGNSIPYRNDLNHDFNAIADYLKYNWLGKGWVNISPRLQDAITGRVLEIYFNAFDHSQSAMGVFSCGQHYPKLGFLHLTVIDFGIGIPTSVRSLPQNSDKTAKGLPRNKLSNLVGWASCPPLTVGGRDAHPTINSCIFFYLGVPNEALQWAFESGNSTKQHSISRGAGLNLLQEFIVKNHGNLTIFSNDGYVNIGDNIIHENKCTNFRGTLINIALRCDESYYCLATEAHQLKKRLF